MGLPIDNLGNNLSKVFLCHECMALWDKVYESADIRISQKNFCKKWSIQWIKFMGETTIKEKVLFT